MSEEKDFSILLIDDDPDFHTILRAFLGQVEKRKYTIESAYDFDTAISILRDPNLHYDAILLDHYLGEHTGIEILRELEVSPLLPPVIVLTGNDDKALDGEAMALGALDFLVKSQISSALLDRAIRYAIEHRKNERMIVLRQREQGKLDFSSSEDPLARLQAQAEEMLALIRQERHDRNRSAPTWDQRAD